MKSVILNINGEIVKAKEGQTVLQAALEADIYIPHLCHHNDLTPVGACNLCVVEVDGNDEVQNSCDTIVEDGMVINTVSPKINELRRLAMELILTGHPAECTGCPKYGKCELQALTQYLEVTDGRLRKRTKILPVNSKNPLFLHDSIRCVQCGRCIRACKDVRGVGVLQFNKKGNEIYVGTKDDISLADAGCRFCGACVEVCPTGTLRDKEGLINLELNKNLALVPCKAACPAGTDVPRYVRYIKEGKYSEAIAVIREKVPFPLSLGHVCNHVCESACRRKEVNESVSIKELKRFAAENDKKLWKEKLKKAEATDKSVAVVGAGPAGLTAGYYLAKQGHKVTIFESQPYAGGMLRVGIPEYRLPKELLQNEIDEIASVGLNIETNRRINSTDELLNNGYNAVVLAIGTHEGVKLPITGKDLDGVLVNTEFLRDVSLNKDVKVGNKVVVLGGGNVAFDCARVAKRLGAEEVHLLCLESKENMPASIEEINEGEEEGIVIHPAQSFISIEENENKVCGVKCLDVKSFTFDNNRRAIIETVEGSEHIIEADTVIFAVGQRPENNNGFGVENIRGSYIVVNQDTLATSKEGVFAAGDAIYGTKSVVEAIESGRRAAISVDKYLGGNGDINEILAPVEEPNKCIGKVNGFAELQREDIVLEDNKVRVNSFCAVNKCFSDNKAQNESNRCLQCDLRTKISTTKFWADYKNK